MKRFLHALAALWPERRGPGSPPVPDTHTGILQHWAAVLRMDGILSECADSRICKSVNETVGAGAPRDTVRSDGGLNVSKREQSKFANQQLSKSAIQPNNLTHVRRPMPLLMIVIPVIFMCLMAAKQVSAQAEPAAAAGDAQLLDRAREFGYSHSPQISFDTTTTNPEKQTHGHAAIPFQKEQVLRAIQGNPKHDLVTYPMFDYKIDDNLIQPVGIGDSLPVSLLNMPLRVVKSHLASDTVTLLEYKDSGLLIIDFWTSWCAPCVASMKKWEEYLLQTGGEVTLLGVHLDYDYKAKPFIERLQWESPSVIGLNAFVLNRHFFTQNAFGKVIWIREGKVIGITDSGGYSFLDVKRILSGGMPNLPMTTANQYIYK